MLLGRLLLDSLLGQVPHPALHLAPGLVTNVGLCRLEFPRRDAPLKQLVNLLERAALELGQEQEEEEAAEAVGPGPDVAVFCALSGLALDARQGVRGGGYPVEILRVDEVRRAKRSEPCEEIAETDGRADGPGPQPRAGQLGGDGV